MMEHPKQLIDDVPEAFKAEVAFTQEVCENCTNCPGVHTLVDGSVVITNDHDAQAPAVILTPGQWEDLKDHIRTGRIE